jgi:DNA-binding NarL/FixJ family response regulator
MTTQVFMVSQSALFGQAVAAWLSEQEDLQIVGCVADPHVACKQIARLGPDIVLLDCSDCESDPTPPLMRFLRDKPGAKVVSVGLDNWVSIYSSEQRLIGGTEEFLQAIMHATDDAADSPVQQDGELSDGNLRPERGR